MGGGGGWGILERGKVDGYEGGGMEVGGLGEEGWKLGDLGSGRLGGGAD